VKYLGFVGRKPGSVTSEPNICSLSAKIYCCLNCDHLQKIHTQSELSAIDAIYASYDGHNLSGGSEQLVFAENLPPKPRTYHAIEQCVPWLPAQGKVLDIGTGNGAVLKSASQLLPTWNLSAFDISDNSKAEILKIPKVDNFYSGNLQSLPKGEFNLIVLWHVLEHVPEPGDFLLMLRECLVEGGFLLIQVPDIERSPFDLAVIDHCSHFTKSALLKLCCSSGFSLAVDGQEWSHNSISLLLDYNPDLNSKIDWQAETAASERYFYWLNNTVETFEQATRGDRAYAIFGTGMAGLWLLSQLSKKPIFFVEEDVARARKQIEKVPIITPTDINKKIDIVMAFAYNTGKNISIKIKKTSPICGTCNYILSDQVN
jgi:SAM-dependent methyltransferase